VRPRLTRVGRPPAALAERATAMLLERMSGRYDGPPRSEIIACSLQPFDTA